MFPTTNPKQATLAKVIRVLGDCGIYLDATTTDESNFMERLLVAATAVAGVREGKRDEAPLEEERMPAHLATASRQRVYSPYTTIPAEIADEQARNSGLLGRAQRRPIAILR